MVGRGGRVGRGERPHYILYSFELYSEYVLQKRGVQGRGWSKRGEHIFRRYGGVEE